MEHLPTSSGSERLGALDSLRGLASCAVLFGHIMGVCAWDISFTQIPFVRQLFDGRSAVTLFFVLSGFVLTFRHLNRPTAPFSLVPFYARRFTRIWLPWFAFFLLSLLAKEWFRPPWTASHFHESDWLGHQWSGDTTRGEMAKQMLFQLHDATRMLLSQDWSLGVELRASLLIPVFLLILRWNWLALAAAGLALSYFAHSTGYYMTSFAAGVLAACWHGRTTHFQYGILLPVIGIIFYQARWLGENSRIFPSWIQEREIWLLGTIGCVLIILGALKCGRMRKLLEHRFFLYLGRISYSLYLVQMIVLLCIAPRMVSAFDSLGVRSVGLMQFLLLIAVSCLCLALADLAERFIEVPCIRLGKSLTTWLNKHSLVRRLRILPLQQTSQLPSSQPS